MDKREIRSKRAAIRQEIKNRMQAELDSNKAEIKRRIRRENLTVEEKRERYRQEVHEEKLRLMAAAKEEFRARKQMLGLSPEQDVFDKPVIEPPPLPEEALHPFEERDAFEEPDMFEGHDLVEIDDEIAPEDAFVITDADESDDDSLRAYESPISEGDVFPPEATPFRREPVEEVIAAPIREEEESYEAGSLFYYIGNLIFHPAQTMDEFKDYLNSPGGVVKAVLFYFVSLVPAILFVFVAGEIADSLPSGPIADAAGSALSRQPNVILVVGRTIFDLLIYSFSIAIINYFVVKEADFVKLTVYFAFIEGVTRIVTYSLIILAIGGALAVAAAPQTMGTVGVSVALLLFMFLIWAAALNVIVLMSAYGYGLFAALLLAIGAFIFRWVVIEVIIKNLALAF